VKPVVISLAKYWLSMAIWPGILSPALDISMSGYSHVKIRELDDNYMIVL
jgi:hypothetical protein